MQSQPMTQHRGNNGEEIRTCTGAIRSEGTARTIRGTAIVFNSPSELMQGYREIIDSGAVELSPDIFLDFDHQSQFIIGRATAGTLSTTIDSRGVHFQAQPPNTSWCADLLESLRRHDIEKCSFSFRVKDDGAEFRTDASGQQFRVLRAIRVSSLSIVASPCYPQTEASIRSYNIQTTPLVLPAKSKRAEDDGECACVCEACESGFCSKCSNPDCQEPECEDCPFQGRSLKAKGRQVQPATTDEMMRLMRRHLDLLDRDTF